MTNNPHELRRVKVQLEFNVMPRQNAADIVDWVNRFFTFFHPNLEARVTQIDKSTLLPVTEDLPADALALLGEGGDEPLSDEALSLLGEDEPPGMDLLG